MPTEEGKWLKFHDGQYQFKVPFMLHADSESILKPVCKRYKKKMNRMKAGRKGRAPYTEKINQQDGVYTVPLHMEMSLTL